MLPQRPFGNPAPSAARTSGPIAFPQTFETVKRRILTKLEERVDLSASRRMPQSLFRQGLRQQADQIADLEARGLSRADRDRMIDEVLGELLGYGPLEELFADATVREIMVSGPGVVIARREQGQWLPTSVKFRDEEHVRSVLDKIATHADAVGPVMASVAVFDMKLPNGFRAVAVLPPGALGVPATAAFLRETPVPVPKEVPKDAIPGTSPTGSVSSAGPPRSGTALLTARAPGSATAASPGPHTGPTDSPAPGERDPLARHRARILEHLLAKFARMGLYDVQRLDPNELRKVIAAYVSEYATAESYMSETEQGRLTLEILTSLRK
jgi:pilus assembly protein CpaF